MGYYTEFYLDCKLTKKLPNHPFLILKDMLGENVNDELIVLPLHPLFKTHRWGSMLRMTDGRESLNKVHSSLKAEYSHFVLSIRCALKNYDNEIDCFLSWITPYIEAKSDIILGHIEGEEFDDRRFNIIYNNLIGFYFE